MSFLSTEAAWDTGTIPPRLEDFWGNCGSTVTAAAAFGNFLGSCFHHSLGSRDLALAPGLPIVLTRANTRGPITKALEKKQLGKHQAQRKSVKILEIFQS